ncbi:MAG: hypothetical protein NC314_03395 [Roseburia sp.]|nr:hypothetical protein [Ruminococcus sp.]MCM1154293.1 hypothetical protein [Roseburia sp.]MCM1241859.1 hypothetical protein [Roseburia sp.]
MSVLHWLANAAPDLIKQGREIQDEHYDRQVSETMDEQLSYARRITAHIRTEGYQTNLSENKEVNYSYQASVRQLETFIRVKGGKRHYLIRGVDDEGNVYEKEFDPYEIDPENEEYTEFTAICLYIQRTEKYADYIMSETDSVENMPEKAERVSILGKWNDLQTESNHNELLESTMKLRKAIHDYWESKQATLGAGQGFVDVTITKGVCIDNGT